MTVSYDPVAFDTVSFETELPVGWVDLGENETIADVGSADGRKIGALAAWNGRIYMGYGDWDTNQPNNVSILAWNEGTGGYATSLGSFNANANVDWRVIDDELWCVSNDMGSGTHGVYGVIDSSHGYTQVTPGASMPSFHLFDAAYFGGAPFIAGASWEASDCSKATVWRYNGSWSVVDQLGSCPGVGRTYGLFTIGSTLYAKASGQSVRYTTNGTSWSTGSGLSTSLVVHPISVNGGAVYKTTHFPNGVATALKHYDGSTETSIESSGVTSHCLGPDGLVYYLKGTSIFVSDDDEGTSYTELLDDAPSNGTALAVTDDAFWIGTEDSHLWRCYR